MSDVRESLQDVVVEIANLDPGLDLLQRQRVGSDGALSNVQDANQLVDVFKQLADQDLDLLPDAYRWKVEDQASETQKLVRQLKNKSISQTNRDGLEQNLRLRSDSAANELLPVITHLRQQALSQAGDSLVEASRLQNQLRAQLSELEAIRSRLEDAAGETGVAEGKEVFAQFAEKQERLARRWLFATGAFVVMLLAWLWIAHENLAVPPGATGSETAGILATRAAVLGVLAFAVGYCARQVGGARHNALVNRHREQSLRVFDYFVAAAESDRETVNAVLLEATRAVFSPQSTGYLGRGETDGSPSLPMAVLQNFPTRSTSRTGISE